MARISVPIGKDGPVIDLGVWVARVMAHAFVAQGLAIPPPVTIRAARHRRGSDCDPPEFVYDGKKGKLLLVY